MEGCLFSNFSSFIRSASEAELRAEIETPRRLLLDEVAVGQRMFSVAYAPFDHVNLGARVVIVGLTPGRQQMTEALFAARRSLLQGRTDIQSAADAKVFASFSGPLRVNLVALLDSIGLNGFLGLNSTASLWARDANLVHFTSVLRYPVFVDGANYAGTPAPTKVPLLRKQSLQWLASEMRALPNSVFIPLGPAAASMVELVGGQVGLDDNQVLAGLPHPSGANAERIAFFLGRKSRDLLSFKVDPDKLLAARAIIQRKVCGLVSEGG